jgi:hypothetical protein
MNDIIHSYYMSIPFPRYILFSHFSIRAVFLIVLTKLKGVRKKVHPGPQMSVGLSEMSINFGRMGLFWCSNKIISRRIIY